MQNNRIKNLVAILGIENVIEYAFRTVKTILGFATLWITLIFVSIIVQTVILFRNFFKLFRLCK